MTTFKLYLLFQTFIERLALFVIPIFVYQLTGDVMYSGIAVFFEWLPTIILLPIAGKVVDKLGARSCLIICSQARALIGLATAATVMFVDENIIATLIAFSVIVGAFNLIAYLSFEKQVSSLDTSAGTNAFSFFQFVQQFMLMLAPIIGLIYLETNAIHSFLATYTLMFAMLICVASKFEHDEQCTIINDGPSGSLSETLMKYEVVVLAVKMLIANLIVSTALTTIPAMVDNRFSLSEPWITVTYIFSATLGFIVHKLNKSEKGQSIIEWSGKYALIAMALSLALSGQLNFMFYLVITLICTSLALPFSVWSRMKRNLLVRGKNLATAISIMMIVSLMGYPLSGILIVFFSHFVEVEHVNSYIAIVALVPTIAISYLENVRSNYESSSQGS